ncbi:MAG: hypothetical protein P4L16_00870 [Chlamydiales bacterium]|nr:hypothetical protein [Chlamydiales bacterium]
MQKFLKIVCLALLICFSSMLYSQAINDLQNVANNIYLSGTTQQQNLLNLWSSIGTTLSPYQSQQNANDLDTFASQVFYLGGNETSSPQELSTATNILQSVSNQVSSPSANIQDVINTLGPLAAKQTKNFTTNTVTAQWLQESFTKMQQPIISSSLVPQTGPIIPKSNGVIKSLSSQ